MAENKTIQDKDLDMLCKHKIHTSLKHIGLKLACQDSSCKGPLSSTTSSKFVGAPIMRNPAFVVCEQEVCRTACAEEHCFNRR